MNFLDVYLRHDDKGYYLESNKDRLYIPEAKADDTLKPYVGRPVRMGVRPEDIHDDESFVAAHEGAVIRASVDVSELMGSEVYLYLKYGEYTLIARVAPTTVSRAGDEIRVALNMDKVHLFDAESELAILN